jgi:hypothetical protein
MNTGKAEECLGTSQPRISPFKRVSRPRSLLAGGWRALAGVTKTEGPWEVDPCRSGGKTWGYPDIPTAKRPARPVLRLRADAADIAGDFARLPTLRAHELGLPPDNASVIAVFITGYNIWLTPIRRNVSIRISDQDPGEVAWATEWTTCARPGYHPQRSQYGADKLCGRQ